MKHPKCLFFEDLFFWFYIFEFNFLPCPFFLRGNRLLIGAYSPSDPTLVTTLGTGQGSVVRFIITTFFIMFFSVVLRSINEYYGRKTLA